MVMTTAFAGQFDRMLASFVSWTRRHAAAQENRSFYGLNEIPLEGIDLTWRCGSLLSMRDTSSMLSDLDTLVYFGLTPPPMVQTAQGYRPDVDFTSAVNLARCIAENPKCRVVLVTRYFPDDNRKLHSQYAFWRQIIRVFKAYCKNLVVIQTMPLCVDTDAVMQGILESGYVHTNGKSGASTNWLNLSSPLRQERLFEEILGCLSDDVNPGTRILSGEAALQYAEIHQLMSASARRFDPVRRLRCAMDPEFKSRAQLLEETLCFHTSQIPMPDNSREQALRDILEDVFECDAFGRHLLLKPVPGKKLHVSCFAQRLISCPQRSVSEITDLLMQWLPRYFQRLVRVDEIEGNRLMCRLSRIPLLELEKKEEDANRCRLYMRNPWGHAVQSKMRLLVMTTDETDNPGELLVIVEDAPESKVITMGIRGILLAFARYLREYGCGGEIPGNCDKP